MAEGSGLMVEARQAAPIPMDLRVACSKGELLAVVGPSGSGKSTLLRTIVGLYRPKEARVTCAGEVWSDAARGIHLPTYRRQVGMVFQSYALFPHMTALANVGAALGHLPRALREDRARELLELMHLGGFALHRPAELSGGQQQRVAVARALARDPVVLLLDEPFSAVDRPTRRRLHDDLSRLRRSVQIPIVLVTHDLDEAVGLADRMVVLDQGTVLQAGKPSAVLTTPASLRVVEILDLPQATAPDANPFIEGAQVSALPRNL